MNGSDRFNPIVSKFSKVLQWPEKTFSYTDPAIGDGLAPMILRAAFWVTVVAVFIPREPDIGYGRPDAPSVVPPKAVAFVAQLLNLPPCDEHTHCTAGLSLASDFRQAARERLERAKAVLKASPPQNLSHLYPPH
jgi:hypothetical protein